MQMEVLIILKQRVIEEFTKFIKKNQLNKEMGINELYINELHINDNLLNLHNAICKAMFLRAEKGEKLFIKLDEAYSEEDIYNKPNNLESDGDGDLEYIRVTALTETMLEYDNVVFKLMSEIDYPAPIIYEGDISDEDENKNKNENNIVTFYRPYFYYFLIDVDKLNEKNMFFVQNRENEERWYEAKLNPIDSDIDENRLSFVGYIEQSASPIVYKGKKLVIVKDISLTDDIIKRINDDIYKVPNIHVTNDQFVEQTLNKLLSNTKFTNIKVYNVGTGNAISINGEKVNIIYDIGYNVRSTPKNNLNNTLKFPAVDDISKLKPSCVILSHWDSDHFMGCAYADSTVFDRYWIAPHCYDAKPNALRLAKYLFLKKKLLLIDKETGRKVASINAFDSEINLWMGENGHNDSHITLWNRKGIVLELTRNVCCAYNCNRCCGYNCNRYCRYNCNICYRKQIRVLMMGDVPYNSLPHANQLINTSIDFLVVPHHGGRMDTGLLNNCYFNGAYAIICAIRGKNRPHNTHKKALDSAGFSMVMTECAHKYLEIKLYKYPRLEIN